MNNLKKKLIASRLWVVILTVAILAAGLSQQAKAVFTPTAVDPADAIAQVTATAADLLPYTIALAVAGIVFKLVRRWVR